MLHTAVFGPDDDECSRCNSRAHESIGHHVTKTLLHLRSRRGYRHKVCEHPKADDSSVGSVGNVCGAAEREQMVFTH